MNCAPVNNNNLYLWNRMKRVFWSFVLGTIKRAKSFDSNSIFRFPSFYCLTLFFPIYFSFVHSWFPYFFSFPLDSHVFFTPCFRQITHSLNLWKWPFCEIPFLLFFCVFMNRSLVALSNRTFTRNQRREEHRFSTSGTRDLFRWCANKQTHECLMLLKGLFKITVMPNWKNSLSSTPNERLRTPGVLDPLEWDSSKIANSLKTLFLLFHFNQKIIWKIFCLESKVKVLSTEILLLWWERFERNFYFYFIISASTIR